LKAYARDWPKQNGWPPPKAFRVRKRIVRASVVQRG
jgi:hypothetical protein